MRSNRFSRKRGAARFAVLTLSVTLGASAVLSAACSPAQAADGPTGVPDYQGARQVLQSAQVHDTVSRFLGATAGTGADGGPQSAPMEAGSGDSQNFSLQAPVALYEITPDFVTGKAKPTPSTAVRLSYLASSVHGADGHRATVLLSSRNSPSAGGTWHLAGIRDGDGDVGYADQAAPDTTVFSEPQIHAWYRLRNGAVQPLNQEAVSGLGGKRSMTLAAYQKLVHGRYADKLPGSAYDRRGIAGGYGLAAPAHHSPSPAPLLLGGSGVALALVCGTFAVRVNRRRAKSS